MQKALKKCSSHIFTTMFVSIKNKILYPPKTTLKNTKKKISFVRKFSAKNDVKQHCPKINNFIKCTY